jgi:chromate transporter
MIRYTASTHIGVSRNHNFFFYRKQLRGAIRHMKDLLRIFIAFFRVGALTFGGGYAMVPILRREAMLKHNWVTEEEMMDYYAVAQCIPGIIAVNTASFIGHKVKKIPGALAAALGVAFPSLIIIIAIAAILNNFIENPYVRHAFAGIMVVVCALILDAVLKMRKTGIKDIVGWVLFIAALGASLFLRLSPIWIVAAAAPLGILLSALKVIKVK